MLINEYKFENKFNEAVWDKLYEMKDHIIMYLAGKMRRSCSMHVEGNIEMIHTRVGLKEHLQNDITFINGPKKTIIVRETFKNMIGIHHTVKNMRKYLNDKVELVKKQSAEFIHIAYPHRDWGKGVVYDEIVKDR